MHGSVENDILKKLLKVNKDVVKQTYSFFYFCDVAFCVRGY